MSITIKDLARIANVSHTTVSRALNDSPLISEETKLRIKALAEQYNYIPNINAKSLVTDRSFQVGIFFSTLDQGTSPSFFYEAVRGVHRILGSSYNLVVKGLDELGEVRRTVNRKLFDGILLMSQSATDDEFIDYALEQDIPIIVLNRKVEDRAIGNIVSADRQGAQLAVDYLIHNGHSHIAIIRGRAGFQSARARTEGYMDALRASGMEPHPDYMPEGHYDVESGYRCMKQLLHHKNPPTAVFCSNDDMAVGAMKAIHDKGLKVPDDISVIGFDDSEFTAYLSPSLTTVKRPIEKISRRGAEMLLQGMNERVQSETTEYVPTKLIIRDSVSTKKQPNS
ncbi:LacI family DNA-binding transcriptional regulator [Marinicrinis lubricantis]|uniref:LacI family DNA-binding transcriptional regulator n=1 Tax=Marinicrinis lubricantis TaxID=2086470 RepID=A0ABW1IIY1_9BACL